ncbi:MAG: polymer-forming cytoskeletal protein [Oscillospiraceae bacterium]
MGLKDNFSQAVKELWKKDGLEDKGAQSPAGPTELDKYLTENPESAQQGAAAVQPDAAAGSVQNVQDTNGLPPYTQQPVQEPAPAAPQAAAPAVPAGMAASPYDNAGYGGYAPNGGYSGGNVPPAAGGAAPSDEAPSDTDEVTIISKNTVIDGNIRSLANMQVDGNIRGNVETTRNIDMSGKIVGDITCHNANMVSAAMQGNVTLRGNMRMDRDTILIGDLTSQVADVNGRIRGKLDIVGKAELKRDAVVFGDINASTIAVTDGAIIQGYVNTTFLSKEDSRNIFPEAITFDSSAKGGSGND